MAIALAFMAGLMQLAMGLARLGALVNFISHTVIVGFTAGAAVLIIVSQLGNFVGLELPRGAGWMRSIELGLGQLGLPHLLAATVGLATMGSGLLARRLWPRVPYMIVAMVVGSGVAALLKAVAGANAGSIRTVGALPGVVPPLSLPDLSPTTVQSLLFPAAVVAVIGLTEAVAIARARSRSRADSGWTPTRSSSARACPT
jgi:SulP family sulfate permease